ncbi:hypothetical protein DFH07DRAFT_29527 [Mycena maculata]|uniref:Uncharacterized protein n=1 Tax=Mycena maculata TaxID=230809 RepID=A0AAD7K253_9AGAR|nr:hypothetical protein DFH07DRAFT_29527 [Mycena maculata]
MENLLARFRRRRTKSLSGPSALTPAGPTTLAPAPPQLANTEVESPPLERKIHPDLDSLVTNWTRPAPVASASDPSGTSSTPAPFSTALRPSTRRHSVDGANPRTTRTDTHLDDLPELPVPIPFTAQPQPPPTRARRLITRLTGSSTPPSSTTNVARALTPVGWSTFGRRTNNDNAGDNIRPHLTDFGERGRGSPAPSQGTSLSLSHSFSPSPSSQVNLGTPSTTSQQLDDSATHSNSGHGHQATTPGSELPSPSSGFTFGSHGRPGRASSSSPPPPMPSLDHPAFRGTTRTPQSSQSPQSQQPVRERHPRSSSSLPSMHSTSRRKRFRGGPGDRTKAQDIFASRSRPGSVRRRASAEFDTGQVTAQSWETSVGREVVFLALDAGGSEKESKFGRSSGDQAESGPDFKFDARAKRVGGSSSDTQLGEPFVWSGTFVISFV